MTEDVHDHSASARSSAMPTLRIDATRVGQTMRVEVCGELDVATGPRLVAEVRSLLESAPVVRVDLDVGRLGFVDFAGLRALEHTISLAASRNVDVAVLRLQRHLRRLLEILGPSRRPRSAADWARRICDSTVALDRDVTTCRQSAAKT